MMLVWFDDPHQYPDKLLDMTDLGTYLDAKYGGYYDGLKGYAMRDGKFIALPLAAIGNAICYRRATWRPRASANSRRTRPASSNSARR
jgi:multiple sugar transport system substrate-binding protein